MEIDFIYFGVDSPKSPFEGGLDIMSCLSLACSSLYYVSCSGLPDIKWTSRQDNLQF